MRKLYNKVMILYITVFSFLFVPKVVEAKTTLVTTKSPLSILVNSLPTADNILCDEKIKELIRKYWRYVLILAPLGLVIMSSVEFLKAIMASDADALTKSVNRTIKRVISTVLLFIIPVALGIIFSWFGLESSFCF